MNKNEWEQKICKSKVKHKTKDKALAIVKELIRKSGGVSKSFEAYRCPVCKKWHLGNNKEG